MVIGVLSILILYGVLIWTYFNPRESLLSGRRGIYTEEPQISESAIHNLKVKALSSIIGLTLFVVFIILIITLI